MTIRAPMSGGGILLFETMKMKTRQTKWTIYPEGDENKLYSEHATYIEIVDEAGGEFVEVTQSGKTVQISPEEWPEIWNTIGTAIKQIIENED